MGVACGCLEKEGVVARYEHARSHESIAQSRHICMVDRTEERGVLWGEKTGRGDGGASGGDKK
jgi:hypothetical protein